MRKIGKILLWLAGGLAALFTLAAVLGLVALLFLDWNALRSTVNEHASDAAGREVEIVGDLKVDVWSWTPSVEAHDVVFGNADWAEGEAGDNDMVRISEAYVRLRLMPLFAGRLEIEELRLIEPEILLERRGEEENWDLAGDSAAEVALEATSPDDRSDFPVLKQVDVKNAVIRFRDEGMDEPVEVQLARLSIAAGSYEDPVHLEAEGAYLGKDFSLEADGASFERFREDDQPYELKLAATIGNTQFTAEGSLQEPVKLTGVDARLSLEGESLVELFELLKLPLPDSPPYTLSGRLTREDDVWALKGFDGRLGESDMGGDVAVDTGGERPLLTADLSSESFRIEDIDGFWGGDDGESDGKSETAAEANAHLLSDAPISLPKMRGMDARVHFEGKAVQTGSLRLEDIATDLTLEDGLLTLAPLELGLAEGRIAAALTLDGREEVPVMKGDVTVEGLDINALMALLGEEGAATGLLQGRVKLSTRGGSMRALGANANGEGALIMSGGRIENLILELIALDLQEAAGQWLTGDDSTVEVLCLAMPTKIENGRFQAQPWILDSTDALVTIDGYVDLDSETVDIELEPHPKDFSLFNYLTSIHITGDLVAREVTTDPLEAAGKVALKALAAPIMPLFSGEIQKEAEVRSVPCDSLRQRLESAMAEGEVNVDEAVEGARNGTPIERASPGETGAAAEQQEVEVSRIQTALQEAGFEIAVDGILGPNTENALRRFQEREGLDPSGRPTARTLRRLGITSTGN